MMFGPNFFLRSGTLRHRDRIDDLEALTLPVLLMCPSGICIP